MKMVGPKHALHAYACVTGPTELVPIPDTGGSPAGLAVLDPNQHALAVDVADLERQHFVDAQPGCVRRDDDGSILEGRHGGEQPLDVTATEHGAERF